MIKRLLVAILTLVTATIILAESVSAESVTFVPYEGYDYNSFDESVPAPIGYAPAAVIRGREIGCGSLNSPKDMFFRGESLYILDSGNGRILVTDEELKLKQTITSLDYQGEALTFTNAEGMFVCQDGTILIADTENERVLVADKEFHVTEILTMPETELIDQTKPFKATKVMRDNNGITYVLVSGISDGAVTYQSDGSFGGFFASNEVERTVEVITDYIWSLFMTEAQQRASKSRTPSEFTNFDIDEEGFIYTVTATAKNENNVRKLNFKGDNILEETDFGDLEWDRKLKESVDTTLVDISVDQDGYMAMLDSARGRIFEYTPEGALITVAGGLGEQTGTLKSPVAIDAKDGKIYVLDSMLNAIVVYEPTAYTTAFKNAINLYLDGKYSESLRYWDEVLKLNSNSEWAYYGIAQALVENEQYQESLEYYKLSYSNIGYSDAFSEVRTDFIRNNFVLLIAVLAIVIFAVAFGARLVAKRYKRKNLYSRSILETTYTYPFYTAIHPFDGFETCKTKKRWSMIASFGILIMLFFTMTAKWFWTGFSFNALRASDFNILITLAQAFLIIFVWTISNWAVCTLIEGKGRLKDIFCMSAYALVPFIVMTIIGIILSNVLVVKEGAFLVFCQQLGIWWTAVLLLAGLSTIHQFSFGKTILSVILTIIGIAIIIFLAIMFFGILKQVVSFFTSIYSEIRMMS